MRNTFFVSIAIFLFLLTMGSQETVFADEGGYRYVEDSLPRLFVEGMGKVTAKPDEALLRLGIVNEEKSLKRAFEHQTEDMNRVINEIKNLGIKEEDIKMVSYNITPMIKGGRTWWGKRKPESFEVSHALLVKIKDLSKIGDIIDKVVAAGAIYIYGLDFKSSKINELEKEAQLKAAKDAKEKAQILADGAGFKIGRVLKVNSSMKQRFLEMRQQRVAYEKRIIEEDASPQIEPGSIELEATCTMIYEIIQ